MDQDIQATSPGRRGMRAGLRRDHQGNAPEKSLTEPSTATGGRNNNGRITSRFRGGGHKRRYRVIDFRRNKVGVPAKVAAIEYDPNRTARIALLHYADGEKRYILAPDGLKVGDTVHRGATPTSSRATPCRCGSSRSAPTIHNIELKIGGGAQIGRSAGAARS